MDTVVGSARVSSPRKAACTSTQAAGSPASAHQKYVSLAMAELTMTEAQNALAVYRRLEVLDGATEQTGAETIRRMLLPTLLIISGVGGWLAERSDGVLG